MSKLKNESAFPHERVTERTGDGAIVKWVNCNGMSKRFYAACAAMQGLISNYPKERLVNDGFIACTDHAQIVGQAYELADELLKQEQDGKE